ncbi:uncharacterized protein LOC135213271 [Macrobrachium nipponense]|uniref:uncharacterized protein LOC135213271 n=1 Tax=Macrobrachium nipponense TaxID=159736 RepID=UPI0030C7CA71
MKKLEINFESVSKRIKLGANVMEKKVMNVNVNVGGRKMEAAYLCKHLGLSIADNEMGHIHIYIFLLASQAIPLCSVNSSDPSNSLAPSRTSIHQAQKNASHSLPQHHQGLIHLGRSTAKDFSGEVLLADALSYIAHHHFRHCSLVVAFDGAFAESLVLRAMIKLPHNKQVIEVQAPGNFSGTLWTSFQCRGYIFLFRDAHSILSFTDEADDPWDYRGKYVFAGLTKKELETIIKTKKGRNTEHITGFVKEKDTDEWKMYMNQLYWGEGMTLVNRWRHRGFTSDGEIFPVKTWDLRGAPIILYTFHFEPHVIFNAPGKRPHGRDIKMADTLAEVLNFTLVIKKSPDGEFWGYPDANGSWNGMNGKLQRREGHFGITNSFITSNDNCLAAIDFSRFYYCDQSCFMTRIEPPVPKWQSLLAPFALSTWIVTLISLLVISPIVYFLANGPTTE